MTKTTIHEIAIETKKPICTPSLIEVLLRTSTPDIFPESL